MSPVGLWVPLHAIHITFGVNAGGEDAQLSFVREHPVSITAIHKHRSVDEQL